LAIERTLVLIRERSLLDLLDLSLVVVRQKPLTLGLAALFGIAPFAALNAWLFSSIMEPESDLPLFLWMVEAPFASAPLTLVLGGLMFGQKPTFGRVVLTLLKAAFPLILVHGFRPAWRSPMRSSCLSGGSGGRSWEGGETSAAAEAANSSCSA
jgi:hypothetical protein